MGAFPSWAPSARTCQIPTPYLQAHGQRVVGLAGVALGEEDHELVIFLSGVVERGYCFCSRELTVTDSVMYFFQRYLQVLTIS
jgi:hypothetical protein